MTLALINLGVSPVLVSDVAVASGSQVLQIDQRSVPDGEAYLRLLEPVSDKDVLFFAPPAGQAATVLPVLFAADAARDQGARRVGLVAPYLGYMRQDRSFQEGEAVSSRTFARLLSGTFDWLLTVDPHLHRYRSLDEIYTIPATVVSAAEPIADWIRENVEKPFIIGPDVESRQWVNRIADLINAPRTVFTKTRLGDYDVEITDVEFQLGDSTPVIVDDVISSARTLAQAVRLVRSKSACAPVCIGVHAIFAGDALEALQKAGPALICTTDTVMHPTNRVAMGGLLGAAITAAGWVSTNWEEQRTLDSRPSN
jgi:ribose-phosphate pyrophosphokinase